jgi:hypothetical protein
MHDGRSLVFKLTQKIPGPDGGPGTLTTIYLDPEEHARLCELPARVLTKTRHHMPPFGFDELRGLWLAEVELDDEEELYALPVPSWAVAEVTNDPRFTGGRLAETTERELALLLASFGL